MSVGFIVARLALAALLATAGLAKLADRDGSRRALAEFGAPLQLAAPLALALPLAELAAAAALVPEGSARWGALAALGLLLLFSAAVARSLARGRAPDCHCFGQLHSEPASRKTIARNAALGALAAFVLVTGGNGFGAPEAAGLAALAAVVALLPLSRREGSRPAPREGLPVGSEAPAFRLPALGGDPVSLESLLALGRAVLLVFTDPRCGPCIALAPHIARWQREHADELSTWVVAHGDPEENAAERATTALAGVLLDPDERITEAYRAVGTPTGVLVRPDGRIGSGVAGGAYEIEALVAEHVTGFESRLDREQPVPVEQPLHAEPTLVRRDLLARFAAGWVGAMLAAAWPAWAAPDVLVRRQRRCPRRRRCGKKRCCPPTFVCRRRRRRGRIRRRCVCPRGRRRCGNRCVRLRTDPRHCGRCGRRCPRATVCVDGRCVGGDGSGTGPGGTGTCGCTAGRTCCEGRCTNLNANEEHCGRCDQACPPGQTCCEGHCRDLQNDADNCRKCGLRCPSGQVCVNGRCGRNCPRGTTRCGDRCVDTQLLQFDESNCGGCGKKCGSLFDTCCDGICHSLSFDGNCGGCGVSCPHGYSCQGRRCICPSGNC